MKSGNFGKSILLKYRLLNRMVLFFLTVAVVTFYSLPTVFAQEGQEQQEVSQEEVEKYTEVKKAAKKEKVAKAVKDIIATQNWKMDWYSRI
jgi:Na+-transporting methylmalonyl-CoA/oxaloacetate decarboxylase gamma subunit